LDSLSNTSPAAAAKSKLECLTTLFPYQGLKFLFFTFHLSTTFSRRGSPQPTLHNQPIAVTRSYG
jgi:hypothetical protein